MKDIWWIHPGKLLLFFMVPVYLFMVFIVPEVWPELVVLKAGQYIRGSYALLGLAILLTFSTFAIIGARVSIDSRQAGTPVRVHPKLLVTIGSLIIIAYGIWFYPALLRGSLVADRAAMNRMPGITSFTQLGVPFVTCYLGASLIEGRGYGPLLRFQFWLILLLTVMRVQLWMERLALIEVGVPIATLLFTHRTPRSAISRFFYRTSGALGPYLGIPALLLMFTATEFFRSWTVYSQTQNLPLLQFMTSRLVTYYFTALNNGAGMLATDIGHWPTFDFQNTADWFYRLPLGIGSEMQNLALPRGPIAKEFLTRWGDVEFNNLSGVFPIIYDLGEVIGILYFCAFGFAAGVLYRSFLNGRALGLLFFPPVYVGCLEIMRTAYLNGPRIVLMMVGCVAAYLQLRAARARDTRHEMLAHDVAPMLRR
jgi:hypothetical protein